MDEQVIRERVSGLSGLGLAEEQRVRRAMHTILTDTTDQRAAAVDQLRIQATRLNVTIQRHLTDHKILQDDIQRLTRQAEQTEGDCGRLLAERESWIDRNQLFDEYEMVCKQILAAGPPVSTIEEEMSRIDAQIEESRLEIAAEEEEYAEEVRRIADLLNQIKSV